MRVKRMSTEASAIEMEPYLKEQSDSQTSGCEPPRVTKCTNMDRRGHESILNGENSKVGKQSCSCPEVRHGRTARNIHSIEARTFLGSVEW